MPNLTVSSAVDAFMQAADKPAMQTAVGVREVLTANRTYFVRTDGNDSNTGLANTAGGAFLTWQGAIDAYARTVDHAGYSVVIQAGQASQTFSIGASLVLKRAIGTGALTLDFNGGTLQSSGTLTDNGPNQRCLVEAAGVNDITIKGVTLTHTNYSTNGPWNVTLRVNSGANIVLDGVNFGALSASNGFSNHIIAENNGYAFVRANYTINGGAGASNNNANHYLIRNDGIFFMDDSLTVTLSGSPKFATFCNVQGAKWIGFLTTFSGSLTAGCTKHSVSGNGVINTFGSGSAATFFPGSVAGTTATGGQFL